MKLGIDARRIALVAVTMVALVGSSGCAIIERIVQTTSGAVPEGNALLSSMDGTGRYVVFSSGMSGLVAGPDTHQQEVYRRDMYTGVTQRVSTAMGGTAANGQSGVFPSSISDGGRYVVFQSQATNLVPGDDNGSADIFVRDMVSGTTEPASIALDGTVPNADSGFSSLSADGRFVAFESAATDLTADPIPPGSSRLYVRDRQLGTTTRITSTSMLLGLVRLSADGSTIVFSTDDNSLVPGDTGGWDTFVVDVATHAVERIDVDSNEVEADHTAFLQPLSAALSADGTLVAFESAAPNLVPGDTNGEIDIFVRDRVLGTTERVDVTSTGQQGTDTSRGATGSIEIDRSGRTVAFVTGAALAPGDPGNLDAYVRDRTLGRTTWVSTTDHLGVANDWAYRVAISADGRLLAWETPATNVSGPEPVFRFGTSHVFVRGTLTPEIIRTTPASLAPGTSTRVTVFGHGFRPGTQLSSGPGVSLSSILIAGDGALKVTVTVAPGATAGPRDLSVTSAALGPDGLGVVATTCAACIQIGT